MKSQLPRIALKYFYFTKTIPVRLKLGLFISKKATLLFPFRPASACSGTQRLHNDCMFPKLETWIAEWQKSTRTNKSLYKTENGARALPFRGYVPVWEQIF